MNEEELLNLLLLENASELLKAQEESRFWGVDADGRRRAREDRVLAALRQLDVRMDFPIGFKQDLQIMLLSLNPELISKDGMAEDFNSSDWLDLLLVRPELADYCECWRSFDERERAELLTRYPELMTHCPPEFMLGDEIARHLGANLAWFDHFEPALHRLSGNNWCRLLKKQPDLWSHCRELGQLAHRVQTLLLELRPEFESECDCWEEFTATDWSELLPRYPHLRDRCETKKWNTREWAMVLAKVPELISECPCLANFNEKEWSLILVQQPQLAEWCDLWEQFSEQDWQVLLLNQPQLLERCPYPLTPSLQAGLIAHGMEVPSDINWKAFGFTEWWMVLRKRPELIEHCSCWDALPEDVRINLMLKQPALKERFGDSDDVPEIWKRCLNIRHPER